MKWRERLEMKAEDFLEWEPRDTPITALVNAHLTGLAEVLEGVEAALDALCESPIECKDKLIWECRACKPRYELRAWREREGK